MVQWVRLALCSGLKVYAKVVKVQLHVPSLISVSWAINVAGGESFQKELQVLFYFVLTKVLI